MKNPLASVARAGRLADRRDGARERWLQDRRRAGHRTPTVWANIHLSGSSTPISQQVTLTH